MSECLWTKFSNSEFFNPCSTYTGAQPAKFSTAPKPSKANSVKEECEARIILRDAFVVCEKKKTKPKKTVAKSQKKGSIWGSLGCKMLNISGCSIWRYDWNAGKCNRIKKFVNCASMMRHR